jgi:hypothetical protein
LFGDVVHCRAELRAEFAAGVHTLVISPQADSADSFTHTAVALQSARPV